MMNIYRKLYKDCRGLASIEFAIIASLILVLLIPFLDFATFALQRQEIEQAHSKASIYAFTTKDNINKPDIERYLRNNLNLPGRTPNITISCNGARNCVNINRPCACLSSISGDFTTAQCDIVCTDGSRSGYYLTIDSSYEFDSAIFASSPLINQNITSTTTLRLQ